MARSTFHLIITKQPKLLLNQARKTFNRLRTKVKTLQKKQEQMIKDLDASLHFYYGNIRPEEDILQAVLVERIKIAYQFYKTPKSLSKTERETFKEMILEDIGIVCSLIDGFYRLPTEIKEILQEITGVNYDERTSEKLASYKDEMHEEFQQCEDEIDVAEIDCNTIEDEIIQARDDQKIPSQCEKKLKIHTFEELEKKSLNSMYKKLARALHPDLEHDKEQKIWKEELIKKVTTAYAQNDLYTLLAIEMECGNLTSGQIQSQSDEQFEIYNALLKKQVKKIQTQMEISLFHPRYAPIQRFYENYFDGMVGVQSAYDRLKMDILRLQKLLEALKTPDGTKIFKAAIKEKRALATVFRL